MKRHGFTLIELLIVVAIIAILAAIAVPNFLEAQTRSKVSRVKSDQRALGVALEAYCVDTNMYPGGRYASGGDFIFSLIPLTTPVAYITSSHLADPFSAGATLYNEDGNKIDFGSFAPTYFYFCWDRNSPWAHIIVEQNNAYMVAAGWGYRKAWNLNSPGPDHKLDHMTWSPVMFQSATYRAEGWGRVYDPTNGTMSRGDIGRFGGDIPVPPLLN